MGRLIVALLAISAPLLGTPVAAHGASYLAQETLWLAWIGCWEGSAEVGGDDTTGFVVCFRPLTTGTGVEIRTYAEGDLISTEQILADGLPRDLEEGGCTGERTAAWSRDRTRVFLASELDCGEGVGRSTRGLLSMLAGGEAWVEIQSVGAGDEDPLVGIRTFVPASDAVLSQGPILDPALGLELAVQTARSLAGSTLTPELLVEIVERAGPTVTGAFLVERAEPFGLDQRSLRALSEQGVPSEVLDIMVAVSYPERFEVSGGGDVNPVVPAAPVATARDRHSPFRGSFRGYSPWGLGYDPYWDPFWSNPYRFGYGAYGYGYRYGYNYGPFGYDGFGTSYLAPRSPRLVFVQPPTVRDRARLSRHRGLVRGTGTSRSPDSGSSSRIRGGGPSDYVGGSARRAPSSSQSSSRAAPSSSQGGSRAAPSSSRGSSRAAPSPSRSSGGGSGNVRRARPRS